MPGGREVEANALIIQCGVQYRGSTELRRRHTFVFHVKQVDIAIDTSPMPFTWRSPPPGVRPQNRLICLVSTFGGTWLTARMSLSDFLD